MKVLQVCAYAAPYEGNFIKSLKALGEALRLNGHEMIYAFPESAREIDWCRTLAQSTRVYFLPLAKARIRPETYIALRRIYKENPDLAVVHSHFELYDVPISMTAPKGIRVFWHLHDAIQMYDNLRSRVIHKAQYGLLNRKATLLSVSQKHMEYVLSIGFPKNRAQFVPNGLDTERIKQIRSSLNERKVDFLIFGWEFERKGVDLCIEAQQKASLHAKVAVVGSTEIEERIHKTYPDVCGVSVVAPVKDINTLYDQTRCFLHISRAEGLSYALLEALYAGLPVICSDIPENLFAQQFETVIMVRSEDVDSIAEAMKKQMQCGSIDPERIRDTRRIIEEKYSLSCWVENMLRYYGVKQ